jgi:hypothetical protein
LGIFKKPTLEIISSGLFIGEDSAARWLEGSITKVLGKRPAVPVYPQPDAVLADAGTPNTLQPLLDEVWPKYFNGPTSTGWYSMKSYLAPHDWCFVQCRLLL